MSTNRNTDCSDLVLFVCMISSMIGTHKYEGSMTRETSTGHIDLIDISCAYTGGINAVCQILSLYDQACGHEDCPQTTTTTHDGQFMVT